VELTAAIVSVRSCMCRAVESICVILPSEPPATFLLPHE